jgi:hypothetical protein
MVKRVGLASLPPVEPAEVEVGARLADLVTELVVTVEGLLVVDEGVVAAPSRS